MISRDTITPFWFVLVGSDPGCLRAGLPVRVVLPIRIAEWTMKETCAFLQTLNGAFMQMPDGSGVQDPAVPDTIELKGTVEQTPRGESKRVVLQRDIDDLRLIMRLLQSEIDVKMTELGWLDEKEEKAPQTT